MATFTRANPYLEEIVQILDNHLAVCNNNVDLARSRLSAKDNEWIDAEVLHCIMDARYFISNYYAVRTEDRGFQGLYPLFDSQEILYEEYRKLEKQFGKVRALVLKARQMGSTTYNCAEFFHKTLFKAHANSIIVGQDQDQATFIMGMYESALDFIPWWMRPRKGKGCETGRVISFDEKDDAIRAVHPGLKSWVYADNANKPSGVGRGKTLNRALLSELAFWQNGSQLSKSLFPTMNTADGFYIMESTANGRNDFWHNLWRRAEAGKIDWHPIFIPFYRREVTYSLPIRKGEVFILTEEEVAMKDRIFTKEKFTVKDETFNWMRNKKEEFVATDGDDTMFSQEYTSEAEESFQSSAITAFPRGIIRRYTKLTVQPKMIGEIYYDWQAGRPKPVLTVLKPGEEAQYPELENRLHVWETPEKGRTYVMGIDVSLGNEGGDYACIQVLHIASGHELDAQVACWHGYIDPSGLAEIVFAMGWWYNEALACVEVNSMGMVTNNELVRNLEYENIYRFKRLDRLKNFMTDIIGWWTDEKSKRALMAKMSKTFLENQLIIRDKFTMDEFNDFTEDGAEGDGAHDDYCFVPETLVRTKQGMVPIANVKKGDAVLSHDGFWHGVDVVGKRKVSEQICVITVNGLENSIRCTDEHPILVRKRVHSCPVRFACEGWSNAVGVERGDAIFVPVAPNLQPPPLTDEEMYLLGWCLADGCVQGSQVKIVLSREEASSADLLKTTIEQLISKHPTERWCGVQHRAHQTRYSKVTLKNHGRWISLACTNKWLSEWVKRWIGKPNAKVIHNQILRGDGTLPFVMGFLEGDGSQKNVRKAIIATQKNHAVLDGVRTILLRHGIWASICPVKINGGTGSILHIGAPWVNKLLDQSPSAIYTKVERQQNHPIARWDGNGFWVTVKSVQRDHYKGYVHNLSVENSHSYTAGEIAAHNCMALMIALYCGHEGETGRRQEERDKVPDQSRNKFVVKNRFDTIIAETSSQNEAERLSKKHVGSSIVRTSSATANITLAGKRAKVPADFANTDFSPIHDKTGTAHRLYYEEGEDAEDITPERIMEFEAEEEVDETDPDAWRFV